MAMKQYLEKFPNIDILQSEVTGFVVENDEICGVTTHLQDVIRCKSVILTTGTSLNGKLHFGLMNFPGGRTGMNRPANFLMHSKISSGSRWDD